MTSGGSQCTASTSCQHNQEAELSCPGYLWGFHTPPHVDSICSPLPRGWSGPKSQPSSHVLGDQPHPEAIYPSPHLSPISRTKMLLFLRKFQGFLKFSARNEGQGPDLFFVVPRAAGRGLPQKGLSGCGPILLTWSKLRPSVPTSLSPRAGCYPLGLFP